MLSYEIHRKYYPIISEKNFNTIILADTISSTPQKNKVGKYAKWLLNLYKKNNLKLEDLYKAQEYITAFDKAVRIKRLPDNDLNHYKSLPDMYLAIRSFLKQPESKSERIRNIKQNEAGILYEDTAFIVIYPKTRAASCLYGKGTQWCTAAKKYNNFSYYNSQGKLYIIIDKINGRKYQFHAETDSFMDETDNPITHSFFEYVTDGLFNYLKNEIPYFEYVYNDSIIAKLREDEWGSEERAKIKQKNKDEDFLYNYFRTDQYKYGTFNYQDRCFYVVMSILTKYMILYNSQKGVLIGLEFEADQILPLFDFFRDEVLIIRGKNKGIYNINSDTVRWGYKGNMAEKFLPKKGI